MRLATSAILHEIDAGSLIFQPQVERHRIGPSSVDLTLSNTFYILEESFKHQRQAGVASVIELIEYNWSRFSGVFGNPPIVQPDEFLKFQ